MARIQNFWASDGETRAIGMLARKTVARDSERAATNHETALGVPGASNCACRAYA